MGDCIPALGGADIMSEILTVSRKNTLRLENLSQNDCNFHSESIGRIYREDNCFGTGFIIGDKLLLSCKHVAESQFKGRPEQCYVCFEVFQNGYDLYQNHSCGVFYELSLLEVASSTFDPITDELDPITNEPYSVEFDAAIFQVNEVCICGLYCALPPLTPLSLLRNIPDDAEIKTVGFPGKISKKSAPLINLTSQELKSLARKLGAGILTESHGKVLKTNNLSAISCPTTAGFSGSPVLCKFAAVDRFAAWAIFIGGPALNTHKRLLEIANTARTDFEKAKIMLIDLTGALRIPFPYIRWICSKKRLLNYVQKMYNEAIMDARQRGLVMIECLNHNLCLPFYRIEGLLNKFGLVLA